MEKFEGKGGAVKLREVIDSYMGAVVKTLKQGSSSSDPYREWFRLCGKEAPVGDFSVSLALECHDQFASLYFMDINHLEIILALDESDKRSLYNNFSLYPAYIGRHYNKIALELLEKEK